MLSKSGTINLSNIWKAQLLISFPNKLTKMTKQNQPLKKSLRDAESVKFRKKAKTELS